MKRLLLVPVALAVALIAAFPFTAQTYSSGAPARYSGPERVCTNCHGTFPVNSGTGGVAITAPATYTPGVPVVITVTVDNTTPTSPGEDPIQGFELSARATADTEVHAGTFDLTAHPDVQFADGDPLYVTHTSASNDQTSWTFTWVMPLGETPPTAVTLYAAGNAANHDFSLLGDYIYTDSLTMALLPVANEPAAPVAAGLAIDALYPNPAVSAATVDFRLDAPARVTALLRDGRGRTVRTLTDGARGAGAHTLRVETDGLAPGLYFVTLVTPEGTRTQPVTVAR